MFFLQVTGLESLTLLTQVGPTLAEYYSSTYGNDPVI